MSLMLASVYDAFVEGGTSDEKSRKATEGKMTLLQWMMGVNIVLTTAVLFKLLS